jgi:hypothetical protein
MIKFFNILIIILIFSFYGNNLFSQSGKKDSVTANTDSVDSKTKPNQLNDTMTTQPLKDLVKDKPISKKQYKLSKSPTTAVLLSFALPGLGQLYDESYWKVPVFVGAMGIFIGQYFFYDNQFKPLEAEYKYLTKHDPNNPQIYIDKQRKESFRDSRDQAVFYLAGVYILAAVDAYVGAHLYDFSVSDDLSLRVIPDKNNLIKVGLTYKW